MKKLKVGVIGTGHLGNLHTKFLSTSENSEFIGVFDIDKNKSEGVGKEHGVAVFNSIEELLGKVEAVSIVSSTSSHYQIAKQALERGIHCLIEKPITATIEEAEELVNIAEQKDLIIQVGHIERFNPALLALEKYSLDPKFIQTDRLAQFNPRGTDVAVVLDLMIHDIDIILSLVKSKVVEVKASGVAVVSDKLDIANARLEFENGAVANVTASRISQKKMRKMRMFQRDSYISIDFGSGVSEVFRLTGKEGEKPEHSISFGEIGVGDNKKSVIYEQPEIPQINALKYEIDQFVNYVLQGKQPTVTGKDGLRALRIADIIIKKIEESKVI